MRRSEMWRNGETESVFRKPQTTHTKKSCYTKRISKKGKIVGPFEVHTRGIGRRLMERQGWREGSGLGRSQKGI